MSNYFDDDAFWDGPSTDSDRTSQIERVRGRSPERTRTHHVVERDDRLEPLDDGSSMWIETSAPLSSRLGPLGSVDPRVLSIGAVALAVVLAVPLFGALGNKGSGDELRAVDQQSTTTASTVATPVTTSAEVVVVTAAVEADLSGDTDGGETADVEEQATDDSASDDTAAPARHALSASPDCANQYTAAAGDYWLRIAEGSGASLDSLLDVNEATAETPIYPGSTVCLPDGAAVPAGFATLRDDDSTAGAATPAAQTAQVAQACANEYESVAGDYWLLIADAAGLGLDELLELNDATPNTPLYPGSVVCLPAGASGPSRTDDRRTDDRRIDDCRTGDDRATHNCGTGRRLMPRRPRKPREEDTTVPPAPPAPGEIEQIIRDVWPDDLEEQAPAHRLAGERLQPAGAELLLLGAVPDLLRRPRQLARRARHHLGRGPLRPARERHRRLHLVPAVRRLGSLAADRRLTARTTRRRDRIMPMASPVHRPPVWLRAGFAALGAAVLLFNALLMLSDRAPGALRRVGGDFVRRLFARIDAGDRGRRRAVRPSAARERCHRPHRRMGARRRTGRARRVVVAWPRARRRSPCSQPASWSRPPRVGGPTRERSRPATCAPTPPASCSARSPSDCATSPTAL